MKVRRCWKIAKLLSSQWLTYIRHKTYLIKNVFFTFKINAFLPKTSPTKCEISQIKILALQFLLGFSPGFPSYFSLIKVNCSLKFVYVTQNFHWEKTKQWEVCCQETADSFHLEDPAESSLGSTGFAYSHRNLIWGPTSSLLGLFYH